MLNLVKVLWLLIQSSWMLYPIWTTTVLSRDIDTIKQLMQSGKILEAVENKVGKLQ